MKSMFVHDGKVLEVECDIYVYSLSMGKPPGLIRKVRESLECSFDAESTD